MNREKMGFEKSRRFQKDYNNVRVSDTFGNKTYHFRSKGEHKIAQYLELLKVSGHIKDWAYEQTKFCFPNIDEPVKTWLIDFDVLDNDGSFYYIEFKGHVERDTKNKLFLLNRYRPEVVVDMVFYNKRDRDKLGTKATSCCRRVCLLRELTKGII